jgi:hypothetical protein
MCVDYAWHWPVDTASYSVLSGYSERMEETLSGLCHEQISSSS